jgi:multidrug resistance efflux pump
MSVQVRPEGTVEATDRERLATSAPQVATPPAPGPAPVPDARPAARWWFLAGLGLVLFAAFAWWGSQRWGADQAPTALVASGTVEADEILIGSEVAGRLVELPAAEGQAVRATDVLARLDSSLVELQITQADPALRRQLELQADKYVLRSPVSGVITKLPSRLGEVVAPGQTVVAVADTSHLKLTLYVLEKDVGQVRVGQHVDVTADPFPGLAFSGTVMSVNNKAEYTPRNIQTRQDRLNLVFGINVRVVNPGGALKPGMPVDATFALASSP